MNKGHGRIETRQPWASDELAGYIDFPYAKQVMRIERTATDLNGAPMRHEVVFGVTSLTPEKGPASRLLDLNRGHWAIENRLHWVRDVTYDEDRSQVRKGAGAQMMAALRNVAIGLLRRAGAKNIAAATRHCCRFVEKALRLIGL